MIGWGPTARDSLRIAPVVIVLAAGLWIPFGCGEARVAEGPAAIEKGTFVDTYVDLRMATLRAGITQLPTTDRDRILEQHGVTEQDLLNFVEVHGRDAGFMHTVWDSIESRIDEERTSDDEAPPGESANGL